MMTPRAQRPHHDAALVPGAAAYVPAPLGEGAGVRRIPDNGRDAQPGQTRLSGSRKPENYVLAGRNSSGLVSMSTGFTVTNSIKPS